MRRLVLALALCVGTGWPPVAAAQEGAPTIGEVRVHGNHATPDADVLAIAALQLGQPVDAPIVEAALTRLRESGRFRDVEILQRWRSIDGHGPAAIVIIVTEHPGAEIQLPGLEAPPGLLGRLRRQTMFLPLLRYEDGYGLTYGLRTTFVGNRDSATRVSVPATWGGTRRIALEAEHRFTRAPLRILGSVAVVRREHPFFDRGQLRQVAAAEISHPVRGYLRVGALGSVSGVSFGSETDRITAAGVFGEIDTRADPLFPRNAVHARTEVSRVGYRSLTRSGGPGDGLVVRWGHDLRGYVGVWRQVVLAGRVQLQLHDGAVPAHDQPMLGGAGSVRGLSVGSFIGDNVATGTVEARIPFTSPLRLSTFGATVFHDVGRTWDHGRRFRDGRLERGVGAGVFLVTPVVQLQLSVARALGHGTRVHLSSGVGW